MALPYPFIPLPAGGVGGSATTTELGIADNGVGSVGAADVPVRGAFLIVVTDSGGGGTQNGHFMYASYNTDAALGGDFAKRLLGNSRMRLEAYDTALTGTTGVNNAVTCSVRAAEVLQVENRSGGTINVQVTFFAPPGT